MKKVISIVLNNFTNDSRVLKTNISLQNAGYDVKVLALHVEGLAENEIVQNIPVERIKLKSKKLSNTNRIIQLIKYFEFMYKVIKKYKKSDIFHCNDFSALPIGVLVKLFFNKDVRVVYDAHEHEAFRAGFSKIRQILTVWAERFFIKYANKVITVSYSIADDYEKIYNIPKPALVLNAPFYKEVEKKDIFREKFNIPNDNIIFLYQGGLGKYRGILEFAQFINNKKNVSYIIMGYGELEKDIRLFTKNSKNVYFHDAVSPEVLLDYTSSADIGICIEEPICKSWEYALPNKLFEYMMCNLPVIVGGLPEMISFVKNNNIGFIIEDIYNLNQFDKQLENIIKTYKIKLPNVEIKAKEFNWQTQEKVLISLYKDLEK